MQALMVNFDLLLNFLGLVVQITCLNMACLQIVMRPAQASGVTLHAWLNINDTTHASVFYASKHGKHWS